MSNEIEKLIEISRFYGRNKEYVIAGGGNTSYKNDKYLYVKASGTSLANITADGFAILDRSKLKIINTKKYSTIPAERENEVKLDLYLSLIKPEVKLRPSVESSLHEIIPFQYVVHTHPTYINALLCSNNSKKIVQELFGNNSLYIEYTDPGYVLFKKVQEELEKFSQEKGYSASIIFIENHGIFVAGDTTEEIIRNYEMIQSKIKEKVVKDFEIQPCEIDKRIVNFLPALRMIYSEDSSKIVRTRCNSLILEYLKNQESVSKISLPFTPDQIVYCKSKPLYIENTNSNVDTLTEIKQKSEDYKLQYGFLPKVILFKGIGLVAVEDNSHSAEIVLDVYEDLIKISKLSENFGGPHFMDDREISFIENWEVENYRRKISKQSAQKGKVEGKICIVTGGAQGFGGGIVERLFAEGANVVIADLNKEKGQELVEMLNRLPQKNKSFFVSTDVSQPESVKNLIAETVIEFGGLDAFISNAGILRAGSLDEMTAETFELMTKVNYNAYFFCAKYASEIMKIQHQFAPQFFMDIIQINSKSGLKGSNKNFAYAGGKFGGIGLTQSFALELIPFNIKVNSICPGNFFDGPLWADPEKGLFVQYLNAGKVPGAQSIEDVKRFYEAQVPARRGCTVEDVMKAIYYIIDQEYETGQAMPVTGGQVMLN